MTPGQSPKKTPDRYRNGSKTFPSPTWLHYASQMAPDETTTARGVAVRSDPPAELPETLWRWRRTDTKQISLAFSPLRSFYYPQIGINKGSAVWRKPKNQFCVLRGSAPSCSGPKGPNQARGPVG